MTNPITNSRRMARTSSYTPVLLPKSASENGNVVTIAGLIRRLQIAPEELQALREQPSTDEHKAIVKKIAALVEASSADQIMKATAALADIGRSEIISAVEFVRSVRTAALAGATAALSITGSEDPAPAPLAHGDSPPPSLPSASIELSLPARGSPPSRWTLATQGSSVNSDLAAYPGPRLPMNTMSYESRSHGFGKGLTIAQLKAQITHTPDVAAFLIAAPYIPADTDLTTLDPLDVLDEIDRQRAACTIVIDALSRRDVQPLGLLHLESLEITPTDVERGELVYSLPLAPHEKVTLSHKEWAVRESEFSEFVQDSIENYSERGVVEADEIAISTQNETRRIDHTGMGSSGGVVMTGPADSGSTVVTNTQSQQESKRHAKTITSQASSRSIRDHKVSFTVATVSGTEDFTSRLIENPKDDRTMRIDYFRRMKRWEVNLYRTGVRLAYDVVIPDPGHRLRLRQDLIRKYDKALAASFDPGLSPADISWKNWNLYIPAYGITLPAPPNDDTSDAYKLWQINCFAAIRDAAYAKFSQVQESIRQRRADLARQIESAADAGSLRQMEQEEIVRLTLAWLVPGFPGSSAAPGGMGEPQGLSDSSWQQALEFGEYIKFVHSAIDWGRLAYFLYPYFWSDRQVERLFLRHPDPAHRDFLRSGAARVIVPIMPGFEEQLTSFVDQGRIGKLPNGHRLAEVVAAVRQANAGFMTPAPNGAKAADEADGKTLIGSWTEFTPTGALDIEVLTRPIEQL